jgi:hypothetical protein
VQLQNGVLSGIGNISIRARPRRGRPDGGARCFRSRPRAIDATRLPERRMTRHSSPKPRRPAIWLATTCVRIADACFALGGSSALYETSPRQRRLLDLHAAAQHGVAQQRHYVCAGKLLLGSSGVSSTIIRDPWCFAVSSPATLVAPGA